MRWREGTLVYCDLEGLEKPLRDTCNVVGLDASSNFQPDSRLAFLCQLFDLRLLAECTISNG